MTDQVKESVVSEEEQEAEYARLDEISSKARECIKRHCIYAAVGGLIPLPFVEVITSSTIQLRMIAGLCDVYGVRFSENAVKNAIGPLVASVLPASGVGYVASKLVRKLPVVGTAVGVVAMPVLGSACTYALGRVFAWHFAKGGTATNFNADAMKSRFKEEFEEGKRKASEFVKGSKSKEAATPAAAEA